MTAARPSWFALTLISARSRTTAGRSLRSSTRTTGTSLSRCARMRAAPLSSVRTTTVIRETPATSDVPTLSEWMLKPRRRNSDETRLRTPG